ncbi:hypothetical protein PVAG01_04338 [Phlyctema vagabunda]|uniref:2EXR domain-containing protein n=1 Tax=Phlyctema vagabunda TaxID=108571 RepID=A0ABR4PNY5_9HELO
MDPSQPQNAPLVLYRPISGSTQFPRSRTHPQSHSTAIINPLNPTQEFPYFSRLPIEIRHSVWRLLRGPLHITTLQIADPRQTYLYTAPYYTNPLLRINQESRALALEACLYFLAPIDLLEVVVYPSRIQVPISSGRKREEKGRATGKREELRRGGGKDAEEEERRERRYEIRKYIKYLTQLQDISSAPLSRPPQVEKSDYYTFPYLSPNPLAHLRINPAKITYLAIDFAAWEFESAKPGRGNLHLVLSEFPDLKELVILVLHERSRDWARRIVTDDLEALGDWDTTVCRLLDVDVQNVFDGENSDDDGILGTAEVWFPG